MLSKASNHRGSRLWSLFQKPEAKQQPEKVLHRREKEVTQEHQIRARVKIRIWKLKMMLFSQTTQTSYRNLRTWLAGSQLAKRKSQSQRKGSMRSLIKLMPEWTESRSRLTSTSKRWGKSSKTHPLVTPLGLIDLDMRLKCLMKWSRRSPVITIKHPLQKGEGDIKLMISEHWSSNLKMQRSYLKMH